MLWCPLFLVFLASAASAEHFQAWKTNMEYQYLVRGRTLAALHGVSDRYTGILVEAILTVQPKSEDILQAKLSEAKYARIHTKLPDGWKSEIPDSMVDSKQFPLSENVFEIKMRHGVVRDIIVDKDVPTWEVNILKSVVSQLQVDTQGENLMPSRYNQEPDENSVHAMYKTMEDTVGGRCEVLYDISPLREYGIPHESEWSIKPELRGNGEAIDIVKTKNYTNCEQRMSHHFGMTGSSSWEPSSNKNGRFMSRSSISRIIITGDLKTFTIQSSVTTDKVILSPNFHDRGKGMVGSKVNITLVKMGPVSSTSWSISANPESTGNLVYNYNNPFAGPGEDRRPGQSDSKANAHNSNERNRLLDEKSQEDDSSASRSSKSANSLESNEQQAAYWQPKPTLNEAPSMSLLPFFIGNGGKSIQNAAKIDPVATTKSLASQIGSDLQNPNVITEEQTLEKFTTLAKILRTMSAQQIAEAQSELYHSSNEIDPHDEIQSVRRSTWVAFRDAVAQAGTGPALVTIKNLLKEKKIMGLEAAAVVAVLAKTARTPTSEYMNAFFEMATMPETTSQEFLNSTAIITFAELVRLSQVNHASAHNRYPVHSFGRLSPKHNPAVFSDYIPYMAEQLKKAIENNELAKSHVFIRALGAIAHPKILAVFEPYLEGKSQASTFQRLLMVMSMSKLASLRPRLARGVLYRLYQNTAEAYQLRCAAVTLIIATNPPESMLQRMAEFTNYDHSKQVNAAVKSAIESATDRPEAQDLEMKARNVLSLLNKESYGFEYSKNYLIDYAINEINIATHMHLADIGSEDCFIPQAVYGSMETIYGDFKVPKTEISAIVSSVKDFFSAIKKQLDGGKEPSDQQDNGEFSPEKIAKLLNLENKKNGEIEAALWMDDLYESKFFSLDKHMLQRIPELLNKASDALKNGHKFDIAKIQSYDVTVSFPLETGLPFVYTFKAPALFKLSGSAKGQANPESVEGSLDIHIIHAIQLQAKLGFIAPFEHQHYMAGVNQNYQIHLPIRADVRYEKTKKRMTLKLEPINQREKYNILESSVIPFTTRHDILSMSPVTKDKETHKLLNGEIWSRENHLISPNLGVNLKILREINSDPIKSSGEDIFFQINQMAFVALGLSNKKIEYRRTRVYLIPNQSSSQSIIFTASYETFSDRSQGSPKKNEEPREKVPKIKSKTMNDPERRKQLLQESAMGIIAAEAFAVDFGIDLSGQHPLQLIMTLAHASSKIDEKSQSLMYLGLNNDKSNGEICAALEFQSPRISPFDMEMAGKPSMKTERFDIEFRLGETCEDGITIRMKGNQTQSEDYERVIKEMPSMSRCLKEAKSGTKSLAACQDMRIKLSTMDVAQMSIEFDPKDRHIKENLGNLIEALTADIDDAIVIRNRNSEDDKDTLKFVMDLDPFENTAEFSYESSDTRVYILNVAMGPTNALVGNMDPDLSMSERINIDLSDAKSHQKTCVIESDSVTTFDQAIYPIKLGKCWHVALTTMPKNDNESSSKDKISEDMKLTVLVRDDENKEKRVKLVLGSVEVELMKTNGTIHATVNGKNVDVSENLVHRHENGEKIEFEVFRRPDDSVRVVSSKYDIDAIYDGQSVRMKASGKYRSDVRGLCGNYDGEPDNDFTSPKNCALREPDAFAASYALIAKDCQGPAGELSKKVDEAECHREKIRPGNVVSDRDAGRKNRGQGNWRYHKKRDTTDEKHCMTARTKVVEEDDQICFSLRPVPSCTPGCHASRTKPKVIPMHCMPKGPAAKQMADHIEQGANPDLSQKEYSKKSAFDMPASCHAA